MAERQRRRSKPKGEGAPSDQTPNTTPRSQRTKRALDRVNLALARREAEAKWQRAKLALGDTDA